MSSVFLVQDFKQTKFYLKENATLVVSVSWGKVLSKPFTLMQVLSKSVKK